MEFLAAAIEEYASAHTTPEPEMLAALNRETHLKTHAPRMLSGQLQGRLLSLLSHLVAPKLVVEIGTFTGYSAICLAEGLQEGGKLITLEVNDEMQKIAQNYFEKAGMKDRIDMRIGEAKQLLKAIRGPVDLVFIDADKENYPDYWDIVFPLVRPGGLIIADNVLWSGKVTEAASKQDEETRALVTIAEKALKEKNAEVILLPVRDGLLVARKK